MKSLKLIVAFVLSFSLATNLWARGGGGHGGGHHGGGHHGGGHHGGHHGNHHGNHNHHYAHHGWHHNGWHGYHHGWHNGWHHGYWGGWGAWPGLWLGGAAGAGWLGANYAYNNPYWGGGTTAAPVDYSQPIAQATTNQQYGDTDDDAPVTPDSTQQQALADMDAARTAFKQNNYAESQELAEKAITAMPDDPALHEFRALTLFAQKNYKEAAAAMYAVLSTGPGWNEETVESLYPTPSTYTAQVKDLQDYVTKNPESADALFLLAYHELIAGHLDVARKDLERVTKLEPNDQLAAKMANALGTPVDEVPAKKAS